PSAVKLKNFNLADLERETRPDDLETSGPVYAFAWGRDTRAEHVAAFLAKVDADLLVTGHIPADGGWAAPNDRQLILDSLGIPAGFALIPATRPLTHAELLQCVGTL